MTEIAVSDVQMNQLIVAWKDYNSVHPNHYNPNEMTWHDRKLLQTSLLEDGWTQPIVTLADGTIVDGEQRWFVAGMPLPSVTVQDAINRMEARRETGGEVSESILARLLAVRDTLYLIEQAGDTPTIMDLTGRLVPVTVLDLRDDAHKMISTVRHNRARGRHKLDGMAGVTNELIGLGLDFDDLEMRLGMDDEEIRRFLQQADLASRELERLQSLEQPVADGRARKLPARILADPVICRELMRSDAYAAQYRERERLLVVRQLRIRELVLVREQAVLDGRNGDPVTQVERAQIVADAEAEVPLPEGVPSPVMERLVFLMTQDEYSMATDVLGDAQAINLLKFCRVAAKHPQRVSRWTELVMSQEDAHD